MTEIRVGSATTTDQTESPAYVGRFAPSSTGSLHFGSLVAALGSYLDARANRGRLLLRIEDIDTPRNVPGAGEQIVRDLERCGLEWDGPVEWQSSFNQRHHAALEHLRDLGLTFPCGCSRRDIGSGPYPGTCRNGLRAGRSARSTRMLTEDGWVGFGDLIQGRYAQNVSRDVGDFVIHRADGIIAYHLAVVVDDAAAGVTRIVRGSDLLDSTPRQILLQRALDLPEPDYAHLPVAVNSRGQKLSKQTHAAPVSAQPPAQAVGRALNFLGLLPPNELVGAPVAELLGWAVAHWRLSQVTPKLAIPWGGPSDIG